MEGSELHLSGSEMNGVSIALRGCRLYFMLLSTDIELDLVPARFYCLAS